MDEKTNREKNCGGCLWFETFIPRPDEKFSAGCKQSNWAGYTSPTGPMICGGLAWAAIPQTAPVVVDNSVEGKTDELS